MQWRPSNPPPGFPRGSEAKWPQSKKLESLSPEMRSHVFSILTQLRAEGHDAKLFYAWRSTATQAKLNAKGTGIAPGMSKHERLDDENMPAADAVDIVHAVDGWEGNRAAALFARLGELAEARGLRWGGRWADPDSAHIEMRR